MQRREMIEQILEQMESELDELTNAQLKNLVEAYENQPILNSLVEDIDSLDDAEDEDEDGDELTEEQDDCWKDIE